MKSVRALHKFYGWRPASVGQDPFPIIRVKYCDYLRKNDEVSLQILNNTLFIVSW